MNARISLLLALILGAILLTACGAPAGNATSNNQAGQPPMATTPSEDAVTQNPTDLPSDLVDTKWELSEINGQPAIKDASRPNEIEFSSEGQVAGSAGCNRFFGSFSGGEGSISFGPIGSTMMACSDELMQQEMRVFQLLESAVSYSIADGTLTITTADSSTLVLVQG
ncbi:MAG: META domain-containing protein [Oscillochloridaceae bacterium umkhey_bin13]